MKKLSMLVFALVALQAKAADVGDVAVIEDTTGAIHGGFPLQSEFCKGTAKAFFATHPDQFDGLVTFTTAQLNDIDNVQQGTPVIWDTQGIGTNAYDQSGQYGSNHKLGQCVFMGSLSKLPQSPDGAATVLGGLPLGISGVELVGHEYGHHWLNWVLFDKNDGLGARDLLRGYEENSSDGTGSPNGHYNHYSDSHSVMYGNFITDNHDGTFTMTGGDRKYGEMDQYLMGLRAPSEVSDVLVVDDGSGHGSPSVPLAKGKTAKVSGVRVDVSVNDVIRAMGPRVPDVTKSQKCWRVAFVLVTPQGQQASQADIAKVEAYRARFANWFTGATDNRGTMDLRLVGSGCKMTPPSTTDAGTPMQDAGTPAADAGSENVGEDAGTQMNSPDPGTQPPANNQDPSLLPPDGERVGRLAPGCGCDGTSAAGVFLAPLMIGLLQLRRRSRFPQR